MGCRISKLDELSSSSSSEKMVALCRERRDLISDAVSLRYDLAAAHAAYFESLAAVGEAFHRFVHEELAFRHSPPRPPVLAIPPPPKAKSRELSGAGRSVAGTVVSAAPAASASSSFTPLHHLSPEGSHLPLSSGSESEVSLDSGGSTGGKVDIGIEEAPPEPPLRTTSPHYSFMRTSASIPTTVYQEPYGTQWLNSFIDGYGYGGGHVYPSVSASIRTPPPAAVPGTPPPPSPREVSPWEFFNIFNSYEQLLLDHFQGVERYASSPDLNKVRAEEGIPELEEELELEPPPKPPPPPQQPPTEMNIDKKAVHNGAADPTSTSNLATAQDNESKETNANADPVAGKMNRNGSANSEGKRSNEEAQGGSSNHNKEAVGNDSANPTSTNKVAKTQETEDKDDKKNAAVEPVATGKSSDNGSTNNKGKISNGEAERGSSSGKTKSVDNGSTDPTNTTKVATAQETEGKDDKMNASVEPVATGKGSSNASTSSKGKRSNEEPERGSANGKTKSGDSGSADPTSTNKVDSAQETEGKDDKKKTAVEPVATGKRSNNDSTSSKGKRNNEEAERWSSNVKTKSIESGSADPTSTTKVAYAQENEGKNDEKRANVQPVAAGKGSKNGSPGNKEKRSNREVEGGSSNGKRKGVAFENFGDTKSVSAFSVAFSASVHDTYDTKDMMEAVDAIKELFRSVANCGQEVSRILEVGKLRYESKSKLQEVISSRICDPTDVHSFNCSQSSFNQTANSISSSKGNESRKRGSEYYYRLRSVSFSSTLEKLLIWEKKLYKAVKDERRLHIKMYNQMKTLNKGTESAKVDFAHETIRKFQTEISIAIRAANAISSRMHDIRDKELQPQLIELIQENIRMWECMLDCHQKQWKVLANSNIQNLVIKTENRRKPIARATLEFEQKLCNWCHSFDKWMNIQRAYIEALNGWISKWLPEEKEITSDGVAPFSPAGLGAPLAFIICNDWYHAVESDSEESVIEVMRSCIKLLHLLCELQDVEHQQRLEEHYLEQAYARKLRSLKEVTSKGHPNVMSSTQDLTGHNHDATMALDSLRNKLDEKRECHKRTMNRVEAVGSKTLLEFIGILKELGDHASEILKAYNRIRIHSVGS